MASVLIADDEARISGFIEKGLRSAGFAARVATTGTEALELALTDEFDLLVLDVNMPGLDGFEVLERLRGSGSRLPVIMLTARVELHDTVAGLEGGADDYLGKPFRFDELLARIRLRMRRDDDDAAAVTELSHRDLTLDIRTRTAQVGGVLVELSAREFELLRYLIENAGRVISRERLLNSVWQIGYDPGTKIVDVYIRYLRAKIDRPGEDSLIQTVRSVGYMLSPAPSAAAS